ncbi:MAG: class I SAM-dependent methyltransferase [Bdellovibrionales bacterium]|nr:class I SAM-dependent methyltransferase [Bdellovibrionales bacterium]
MSVEITTPTNRTPEDPIDHFRIELAKQVHEAAGRAIHQNQQTQFSSDPCTKEVKAIEVLPFVTDARGTILPASTEKISACIPGYAEPTASEIQSYSRYSDAAENYGTAPGPATAFIANVAKAMSPSNAFCFGTGRGRLESVIAEQSPESLITTIDIPDELVTAGAPGAPDGNNARYRSKLGVRNETIGELVKDSNKVIQLLGDSFELNPGQMSNQFQLIVIDANHQLPSVLNDAANALLLADTERGAVIIFDDCRKSSSLNTSVEGAVGIISQATGLCALTPCPPPNVEGFSADIGFFVIPPGIDRAALSERAERCKALARTFKDLQPLV